VHQYQQEKNEHTSFVNALDRVYRVGVSKEAREAIFEGLEHLMLATILGKKEHHRFIHIHQITNSAAMAKLMLISNLVGTGLWYGSVLRIQDLLSKDELIAFALITGAVVTSIESIMKVPTPFTTIVLHSIHVLVIILNVVSIK
jgi:hypothetical protein